MDWTIVQVYSLLFVAVCLFIYTFWGSWGAVGFQNLVDSAASRSSGVPTVFEIRDKSPIAANGGCDRLIVIEPFGWVLWCVSDKLYILMPESMDVGFCRDNSTPAVRVYGDRFVECCLSSPLQNIIDSYSDTFSRDVTKYRIPYTVDPKTRIFTILTAINALKNQQLIDFDPAYDDTVGKKARAHERFQLPDAPNLLENDARRHKRSERSSSSTIGEADLIRRFASLAHIEPARFLPGQLTLPHENREHVARQVADFVEASRKLSI